MMLHEDLLKIQYGDVYIQTPTDKESVQLVVDFLVEIILKREGDLAQRKEQEDAGSNPAVSTKEGVKE